MFGYVTFLKDELRIREFREYKAVYCSLCRTLGKEYGIFTRFILSYDCTFYSLLLSALQNSAPCYEKKCCRFNPFKKCFYIKNSENILKKAAALSVSSINFKIHDNISDSKGFKRIFYKFLFFLFKRRYNKAEKNFPGICDTVRLMSQRQFETENNPNCHIDMAADPTATMLADLLSLEAKDKNERLVLHTLGYNLGRWIYLIDAADDLEKDIKKGNFNPFREYFNRTDFKEYCLQVLNQCLAEIYNAWQLLDVYYYKEIIENILVNGLTARQKKVLFSEERNGKKSV